MLHCYLKPKTRRKPCINSAGAVQHCLELMPSVGEVLEENMIVLRAGLANLHPTMMDSVRSLTRLIQVITTRILHLEMTKHRGIWATQGMVRARWGNVGTLPGEQTATMGLRETRWRWRELGRVRRGRHTHGRRRAEWPPLAQSAIAKFT